MGKRIDHIVFTLLTICLGFAYFLFATESIPLAVVLTFAFACLISRIVRQIQMRQEAARARKRGAQATIHGWMFDKEQKAELQAAQCVCRVYAMPLAEIQDGAVLCESDGAKIAFTLFRCHPSAGKFTADDLLQIILQAPPCDALVVIATGKVDAGAKDFASEQRHPKMRIFDLTELTACLLKDHALLSEPTAPAPKKKQPFGKIARGLFLQIRPIKAVSYGAVLMALYFVLGGYGYLLSALLLITAGLCRLRKPQLPKKLFPGPMV